MWMKLPFATSIRPIGDCLGFHLMEGPMVLAGRVDLGERRHAALDLLTQYIRIVDDPRRIEEWPALFSDDAEYIVITRENHERNLPIAVIRDDSKDRIADRVTIIRERSEERRVGKERRMWWVGERE